MPKLLPASATIVDSAEKLKDIKASTSSSSTASKSTNHDLKKATKTKKRSAQPLQPPATAAKSQLQPPLPTLSDNDDIESKTKPKRSFKRIKRDLNSSTLSSLDPEITNLIKAISSNTTSKQKPSANYKESLAFFSSSRTSSLRARLNSQSIAPKTAFSSSLFGNH